MHTLMREDRGYVNPRQYGVTLNHTTLSAALAAIGSTPAALLLTPGTWTIGANLTIPATITLVMARGALLSIATAVTLTINGDVDAGLWQIFALTGTGQVLLTRTMELPVQWWGARNDYDPVASTGTNSTLAVQQAFAAACLVARGTNYAGWKGASPSVHFPAGMYYLSLSANALVPPVAAVEGVMLTGAGMWQSILYLDGGNYLLYNDNTIANFGLAHLAVFGRTGNERLCYYNSTGTASRFRRQSVTTRNLAQLLNIQGTANADYNVHLDCDDFHNSSTVPFILINNAQSVCHYFYNCHVSTNYRYLEVTRGGSVYWYGGGVLINGASYFCYLNNPDGSGIGTLNGQFVFHGLKSELANTAGLLYSESGARVTFQGSLLRTRSADQLAFVVNAQGRLEILDCDLDYRMQVITTDNTFALFSIPAVVVRGCELLRPPDVLFTESHTGANVGGRPKASFVDCTMNQAAGSYPTLLRQPVDSNINYKLGFTGQARTERVMTYQALPDGRGLPNNTVTTFYLPKNCLVTRILLVNSNAVATQWRVTGPSTAVWVTSGVSTKMTQALVNEEVGATNTFTMTNITDGNYGDGYLVIWYL